MNYEQRLKLLEITKESSIDDLKSSYRRLAKKYHPDLNKNLDGKLFNLLTESYDWLIENHKPVLHTPVLPKKSLNGYQKFYRIIPDRCREFYIKLPIDNIDKPTVIICMIDLQEFRVFLEEKTTLPISLEIFNLHHPLRLNISSDGVEE